MTKSAKRQAVLLSLGLCAIGAAAAPISPEAAWQRACNHSRMQKSSFQEMKLAYSHIDAEGAPVAYLFQRDSGNGFVLLSADDRAVPVLGYSDCGAFDASSIPPALQYLLDGYAAEIASAGDGVQAAIDRPQREEIKPLLTTLWDQEYPYNLDCPEYMGVHTSTGCMATSASQVMNYHKWPDVGEGSASIDFLDETYSIDYPEHPFDWANMLDEYTADATKEQMAAVANLMYCVGVAEGMFYNFGGSGSYSRNTVTALTDHFKYDNGAYLEYRYFYPLLDWENMVYEELSTNGPVIYDGVSPEVGHSFVCDGYQGDGFFHINWGWSGLSNGYYLLSALTPSEQGTGGGTSGYNYGQVFVRNLKKRVEGVVTLYVYVIGQFSAVLPYRTSVSLGTPVDFKAEGIGIYNMSVRNIPSLQIGLSCKDADGNTEVLLCTQGDDVAPMNGVDAFQVTFPTGMKDGEYELSYVWRVSDDDAWQNVKVDMAAPKTFTMKVEGGVATFSATAPKDTLVAETEDFDTLERNTPWDIEVKITNEGAEPFYGGIQAALCQRGSFTVVTASDFQYLDVAPGETVVTSFLLDDQQRVGTYTFYVMTEDGTVLLTVNDVKVVAHSGVETLDAQETEYEYFDLTGKRIAGELPAGLYIRVARSSDAGTTAAEKWIVK